MTRILTQRDVRSLLPMDRCIELVRDALLTLARGEAVNPLRTGMWLPDRSGILATMPGFLDEPRRLGLKIISVFPGNETTEWDAHQGLVVLLDADTGVPLAIMDGSEITAIRTAAATAVATDALARQEARTLALIGSSVQARTHLEAILAVRPITDVRCYSRSREHRERFAAWALQTHGVSAVASPDAATAVRGADVVCTVTSSAEPVLSGDWLEPGMHINAVGSSIPSMRELDSAAVARSTLFVDRRESALNEAGDIIIPIKEGTIDDGHIRAEIGDVLLGTALGRREPTDITLFKSLGIAVEDVAPAAFVYERAVADGIGVEVPLGGLRHAAS